VSQLSDLEKKKLTSPVRSKISGSDLESMSVLSRNRKENGEKKARAEYSGISITVINPTLDLTWKFHEVERQFPRLENDWITLSFLLISNPSLITVSLQYIFTRFYIGKKTRFRSDCIVQFLLQ
jgi:hypothetical protein